MTEALEKSNQTQSGALTPMGAVMRINRKDDAVKTLAFGVDLDAAKGHVVDPPGMKPFVTGVGYNYANQVAGISVMKPSTIMVDGERVENPHVARDEHGIAQRVICRMTGFRRSVDGDWYMADASVVFDFDDYLLRDLQSKVKKYPVAGMLGLRSITPETWSTGDTNGKGEPIGKQKVHTPRGSMVFYGVSGDVGLWADLGHPEIQKAFSDHIQRRKFADRIAQSIARRNVLKAMFGVSTVELNKDGHAQMMVTKTTCSPISRQTLEEFVNTDQPPKELLGTSTGEPVKQISSDVIDVAMEEFDGELAEDEPSGYATDEQIDII